MKKVKATGDMKSKLALLSHAEKEQLGQLINELTRRKNRELSQVKFFSFCAISMARLYIR